MTSATPAAHSDPRQLLTHSRMACYKTCPRKHFYSYELGLRKAETSTPLRFGSLFHEGLDQLAKGEPIDVVLEKAVASYTPDACPSYVTPEEWQTERETLQVLLAAYHEYWRGFAGYQIVASEIAFRVPIENPQAKKRASQSRTFVGAGKIDKIVRLADGRLAIMEHKTSGMDINPNSDYWRRLRLDQQISFYFIAARHVLEHEMEMLEDVSTVVYDVIRKPMLRPSKLTKAQQAEAKAAGWGEIERETPEMFGNRLWEDIRSRPEFYFQRQEIARLASDCEQFEQELWDIAEMIRHARKGGRWYRNTGACFSPYRCEFFDVCCQGWDKGQPVPEGFRIVEEVHQELVAASVGE